MIYFAFYNKLIYNTNSGVEIKTIIKKKITEKIKLS